MNDLINDIFGDGYITLQCEGGECLHYSQVPGYVVGYILFIKVRLCLKVVTPSVRPNRITQFGLPSALQVQR
jgi:hypothetical protein